ncbi:MAG TPA: hypothetical protein VN515_01100, partial [Terriglobales bacterium]|nr:hypothetical protein [Terriglobales bacterium]
MATILISLALFLAVAATLFAVGAAWAAPTSGSGARLRQMLGIEKERSSLSEKIQGALEPAAKLLPPSAKEATQTRRWLIQAGYREPKHARFFFGLRAISVMV